MSELYGMVGSVLTELREETSSIGAQRRGAEVRDALRYHVGTRMEPEERALEGVRGAGKSRRAATRARLVEIDS